MPDAAEQRWYYMQTGKRTGPCQLEQLAELLRRGELTIDTLVRTPGLARWMPAREVEPVMLAFARAAAAGPPALAPTAAPALPTRPGAIAWQRAIARAIDYYLAAGVVGFLLPRYLPFLPQPELAVTVGAVVLWIPLEALLLSRFGTTPGGYLHALQVQTRTGGRLDFGAALRRSLDVWLVGVGLGIPVFTWISPILAYRRLRKSGATAWDERAESTVVQLEREPARIVVAVVAYAVILLSLLLFVFG